MMVIKHNKTLITLAGLALLAAATPASADIAGMQHGRNVNLALAPKMSLEAGVYTGDMMDLEYQHIGARVNYKLDDSLLVYGDVGESGFNDFDGLTFGVGAYYQLLDLLELADTAIHASYHMGEVERGRQGVDINALLVDLVFSSREAFGPGASMNWYGSVGLSRFDADADDEIELALSGGVVAELSGGKGQVYGGLLYLDDASLGIGYRHYLR